MDKRYSIQLQFDTPIVSGWATAAEYLEIEYERPITNGVAKNLKVREKAIKVEQGPPYRLFPFTDTISGSGVIDAEMNRIENKPIAGGGYELENIFTVQCSNTSNGKLNYTLDGTAEVKLNNEVINLDEDRVWSGVLEVKLTCDGVTPSKFRFNLWGELLIQTEDATSRTVIATFPMYFNGAITPPKIYYAKAGLLTGKYNKLVEPFEALVEPGDYVDVGYLGLYEAFKFENTGTTLLRPIRHASEEAPPSYMNLTMYDTINSVSTLTLLHQIKP